MAQFTTTSFLDGSGRFDYNPAGTQSFATARAATAATASSSTFEVETENSGGDHRIQRVFLAFDTSSIPTTATITGLTVGFNARYEGGYTSTVVHLVQSTQTSTSSRDLNDYDNVGFVSGGSVATPDASLTAKTITGNATSFGWITKAGTSSLAIISEADQSNTAPGTNHWATLGSPSITIDYTLPTTAQAGSFHFM